MNNAVVMKNGILAVLAAIGAALAEAVGGWDQPIGLLVMLMAMDYISGMAVALVWKRSPKTKNGKASSDVGFRGLLKKAMILGVVLIACQLDRTLGVAYIRLAVILFFAGNEGISLVENLGLMGIPFPAFVTEMFEALHEKGNSAAPKE